MNEIERRLTLLGAKPQMETLPAIDAALSVEIQGGPFCLVDLDKQQTLSLRKIREIHAAAPATSRQRLRL